MEEFITACKDGCYRVVTSYFNFASGHERQAGLNYAVAGGHYTVTQFLIQKRVLLDLQDGSGFSVLMSAVKRRYTSIVKLLIEAGANLNLQNNNGESALLIAARISNIAIVNLLIQSGAILDLQDNNGLTALHIAVEGGNFAKTKLLACAGANLDILDYISSSPLMNAILHDYYDIVELLINLKATVDLRSAVQNSTALILASTKGSITNITNLIAAGANVNAYDENGRTPLMYACLVNMTGSISSVKLLLNAGADVCTRSNNGVNALHYACEVRNITIVRKLLRVCNKHSFVNHITHRTPLMIAASNGDIEIVQLLLKYKADTLQKDTEKKFTAEDFALEKNHEDVATLLFEHRSTPTAKKRKVSDIDSQ